MHGRPKSTMNEELEDLVVEVKQSQSNSTFRHSMNYSREASLHELSMHQMHENGHVNGKKVKIEPISRVTAYELATRDRIELSVELNVDKCMQYMELDKGSSVGSNSRQSTLKLEGSLGSSFLKSRQQVVIELTNHAMAYWCKYFTEEYFKKLTESKGKMDMYSRDLRTIELNIQPSQVLIPLHTPQLQVRVEIPSEIQLVFELTPLRDSQDLISKRSDLQIKCLTRVLGKEQSSQAEFLILSCVSDPQNIIRVQYTKPHNLNDIQLDQVSCLIIYLSNRTSRFTEGTEGHLTTLQLESTPDCSRIFSYFPNMADLDLKRNLGRNSLTPIQTLKHNCERAILDTSTLISNHDIYTAKCLCVCKSFNHATGMAEIWDFSGKLDATVKKELDGGSISQLTEKLVSSIGNNQELLCNIEYRIDYWHRKVKVEIAHIFTGLDKITRSLVQWKAEKEEHI